MFERALVYKITHNARLRNRFARLIAERDGADLVSLPAAAVPIWPVGEVPQKTPPPFVTYAEIGDAGTTAHQGGRSKLSGSDVQINVWCVDFSDAQDVRDDLRVAIVGVQGTFDGETLRGVFLSQRQQDAVTPADHSEDSLQAASVVLKIWHTED